jgi:chromosome segregation ATPase
MISMVRVLESEIRDLERIIAADEAILEIERLPAKRSFLRSEVGDLQNKIDRLKARIEDLSSVD